MRDRATTASCSFRAVIKVRGINPFILVSAARAGDIKPGWRKPLPVCMHINGKPADGTRTNMMPAGDGSFYLYLNGEVRTMSDSSVGDWVRVKIAFDPNYRNGPQHPMPRAFKRALAQDPQALKNWARLTASRKKELLRYFAQLKSPESRARNLAIAVLMLSGQAGRFMAREWRDGS